MKLTVIIPVYNTEKYLPRCLDSIINQTYKNWEVIAIDDGSEDNSYSLLSEYSVCDKRFKVLKQTNRGPGYARNEGISITTGDYIIFIDSDDYVESNYFEELIACISSYNSDVVFVDVIQEKPDGKVIKHEIISNYRNSTKDKIIRHQMTGKLPWGGCRKVIKSSLILDNNIRYSNDTVGEEALFSFNVLVKAEKISFLNKAYYHYVNYPISQSKKGNDDPWGGVCDKVRDYLEQQGILDEYKETINSFGFTSLIVSIYRRVNTYRLRDALSQSKIYLKAFRINYGFKLDLNSLEMRVRLMLPFAKLGIVWPIVLAAKLKKTLKYFT